MNEIGHQWDFDENGTPTVCCGNCVAYRPNPKTDGQGGDCRMNPPFVVVITSGMVMAHGGAKQSINTVFPPVPKGEMCMKFAIHPVLYGAAEKAIAKEANS